MYFRFVYYRWTCHPSRRWMRSSAAGAIYLFIYLFIINSYTSVQEKKEKKEKITQLLDSLQYS